MPKSIPIDSTILAFDFGLKHIGVAVGQLITKTANPLTRLAAKDGIPQWDSIGALITEWQVNALVVGLPLNMDNSEQFITKAAKKFANRLQQHFKLPVFLVDERLSTIEAKKQLHQQKNFDIKKVDQYAAKIILETWLNEYDSN